MNLTDLFTTASVATHWTSSASNSVPLLGTGFWPAEKKAGLSIKWVKGHDDVPISLSASNFDAKPTFRDRDGVSLIETELAFFRESFHVKEIDEQIFMELQNSSDPRAQEVLKRLYKDSDNLIDGANIVAERMRMQLLSSAGSPSISIVSGGLTYSYNYDVDGSFAANNYLAIASATDKWTDTVNSDPFTDLENAIDSVETRTGVRPTVAIMNKNTFKLIRQNKNIHNYILAQNVTANIRVTDSLVKAFLLDALGLTILVYSKTFRPTKNGAEEKFYPDNFVALIPNTALGTTWYGTTPEERSGAQAGLDVSIVNTGVAVTVNRTKEIPVQTSTTASEIVIPSFERMDEVYVMKVA